MPSNSILLLIGRAFTDVLDHTSPSDFSAPTIIGRRLVNALRERGLCVEDSDPTVEIPTLTNIPALLRRQAE
jgi:hypothetical protein